MARRKSLPPAARKRSKKASVRTRTLPQEFQHLDGLIEQLNNLSGRMSREQAQDFLDREFKEELEALLAKIGYIRQSQRLPTPDEFWRLMLEVVMLIMKLIAKVFWLQQREMPRIDPRLPNPTA